MMSGRVVVITGATSGIGRATALGLAEIGASMILIGRSRGRLASTSDDIVHRAGGPAPTLLCADLSSLTQVRHLAAEVRKRVSRLDVLINNAGTIVGDRRLTADGYEYTFALDHLSPFLLTNLLLDLTISSAPSRIITVSSSAHFLGRIRFDDLMMENNYSAFGAYCQAKLANVLFTYELARRLSGTGVTANCLNPGGVRTHFGDEASGALRAGLVLARPFEQSPERGARTPIYLASSPEAGCVTGRYFVRRKVHRSSPASYDGGSARRLWEVSARLTALDGNGKDRGSRHNHL
jgi:NAD(P)-dependent dehydrogenase (short-subunit alcohol dehydrogenase family)